MCVEDILNLNSGLIVQSTKLYHGYLLHLKVFKVFAWRKYQVISKKFSSGLVAWAKGQGHNSQLIVFMH